MAIFGYARLTKDGPSLSEQTAQLESAGCIQIFLDHASSTQLSPDELSRVLSYLRKGDALVVTRLDHLARSTPHLYHIVQAVAQVGASLTSLGDPWVNTTGTHRELMLNVLRGIADFETGLMRRGRARAKAKGVKLGRRAALTPPQCEEVLRRVAAGESQQHVAQSFATSRATISRVVRRATPNMITALGVRGRIRRRRQLQPSSL
jgi:DNA invertase Pin-like site-specific DNA recombinase